MIRHVWQAIPKLLDLYSGAGGAARGYANAGYEVIGVDCNPQPRYPYRHITLDALDYLRYITYTGHIQTYAAIHASPPCQEYSTLKTVKAGGQMDVLDELRALLNETALPWVIENVVGAPLENPLLLCGTMFGLGTGDRELRRHRHFELGGGARVAQLKCMHEREVLGVYGDGGGGYQPRGYKAHPAQARRAMQINWMNRKEISQAIPPAYTQYIGAALRAG